MSLNHLLVMLARCVAPVAALALGACTNGGAISTGGGGKGCGMAITSPVGLWLGSGRFVGTTPSDNVIGMIGPSDLVVLDVTGTDPLNAPLPGYFWFGRYSGTSGVFTKYAGGGLPIGQGTLDIGLNAYLNLAMGSGSALISMCPISNSAGNLYDRPTVNAAGEDMIVGGWRFKIGQTYQLDYVFDSGGFITGTDTQSCAYSGNWVADPQHKNLYHITGMSLTNGSPNACNGTDAQGNQVVFAGGDYNGLAMFFDTNVATAPSTLWLAVANGKAAFFSKLTRSSTPPTFP